MDQTLLGVLIGGAIGLIGSYINVRLDLNERRREKRSKIYFDFMRMKSETEYVLDNPDLHNEIYAEPEEAIKSNICLQEKIKLYLPKKTASEMLEIIRLLLLLYPNSGYENKEDVRKQLDSRYERFLEKMRKDVRSKKLSDHS